MSKITDKPWVCVVKIERTSRGWEAILFYRDDYGSIVCFTLSEGHSECCLEYYWGCKHPKTPEEWHEADRLFAFYDMLPDCDIRLVRRKKLERRR